MILFPACFVENQGGKVVYAMHRLEMFQIANHKKRYSGIVRTHDHWVLAIFPKLCGEKKPSSDN